VTSSVLAAENLAVESRLHDGRRLPVLSGISFALEAGKVLGLVGESGAGKSMIGRAVAQLLPPGFSVAGGSLAFAGRDLVRMGVQARRQLLGREIAFIPQEPLSALNPVMTIGAQFGEHLARLGITSQGRRREEARAMLEAVHLPRAAELLRQFPHELSGGMCQRVLIAMAFASRPKLVIADEPTTALDATIQARIIGLMGEMRDAYGAALMFITHDLRLAAEFCDEIVVLYAGRAVEKGEARKLLSSPLHPYTRCLQLAVPSLSAPERELFTLPGEMPGLARLGALEGCRFAPRCPNVGEICRKEEPKLLAVAPSREAACFRSELTLAIETLNQAAPASPKRTAPLLRVDGLKKRYVSRRGLFGSTDVLAIDDVSFAVAENEFVGVVGESGSGKSTLAKLIIGLERPSSGRIELCGQDAFDRSEAARRRRIEAAQMVFQDPQSALNPRRRAASIVTLVLEAAAPRLSLNERQQRAEELLAEVGLSAELGGRYPSQLSGGQKQRVNIARALCAAPKLLIADEIVSGLDVSVQAQLIALLHRLRRELSFALLFISHDLAVVRKLCERVLVMWRGKVVEEGLTAQVFATPQHPYTRELVGASNTGRIANSEW
jgi:peptide/nickel transport system ATP-binding protein